MSQSRPLALLPALHRSPPDMPRPVCVVPANGLATNTYSGNSGISKLIFRSFHRRMLLYSGKKCSTLLAPSRSETRLS